MTCVSAIFWLLFPVVLAPFLYLFYPYYFLFMQVLADVASILLLTMILLRYLKFGLGNAAETN